MSAATATTPINSAEYPELKRQLNHNYYRPLYLAALKGDWKSANRFFEQDHNAMTAKISVTARTALHIAAIEGQSDFLEKLVDRMPPEATSSPDAMGYTALHYAAIDGSLRAVKTLVSKNPALAQTLDNINGFTPLLHAVAIANEASPQKKSEYNEVIWFLCLETTDAPPSCPFTGPNSAQLITRLTYSGFYDISLYLLQNYPNLATTMNKRSSVLAALALKPSDFPSGSRLGFLGRCIYPFMKVELSCTPPHSAGMPTSIRTNNSVDQVLHWFKTLLWKTIELLVPCVKQARDEKWRHQLCVELVKFVCRQVSCMDYVQITDIFQMQNILVAATVSGTVEIVRICCEFFPDIIWIIPSCKKQILQVAIKHRREKIFNLMVEMNGRNRILADMVAGHGENILRLAAKLAPSRLFSVSGSAFQMQREIQWFKEVEKLVRPVYKEDRATDGKTAWEVFTEEHKDLIEKGEKWMKDTSNSCMVVSTLIATVVFAAAFTVPGGNSGDKGIPIFLTKNSFMVFAISDAVALFSSATSLLMFLSILTSRYAAEDFLSLLPKRLIIGLASLFFAIASMMVAFGATLSIVLGERLKWVSTPVSLIASFPVIMFVKLQLPLFIEMVKSTYGYGIFHPEKLW